MSATESTVPDSHLQNKHDNAEAIDDREASPASPTSDSGRGEGLKWDPFSSGGDVNPNQIPTAERNRRQSKEWDAAKVPPSRFQKREGSIHATPASRDGHVDKNKLKEIYDKYNAKYVKKK